MARHRQALLSETSNGEAGAAEIYELLAAEIAASLANPSR
jgi:hypothetical protein